MTEFIERIFKSGIKDDFEPWEIHLTRKLNFVMLFGAISLMVALFFLMLLDYSQFYFLAVVTFLLFPIGFIINRLKGYIWTIYIFYAGIFSMLVVLNLQEGKNSDFILYYFPCIIAISQLLGRNETLKQFYIVCGMCLISIFFVLVGFKFHWLELDISPENMVNLSYLNLFICFTTTIIFVARMVLEALNQENLIISMLKEKEILLAEVFHRVKNNLNIVNSLLNLKKNATESPEAKTALEECRNRVFSMALVHDSVYNSKNNVALNFKDYIKKLSINVGKSLGLSDDIEIVMQTEDIQLNLTNAIPCGLIVNEFITNSFKHARSEYKKLIIQIKLKQDGDSIEIEIADNGPGLQADAFDKEDSLGMDLIKSLSKQINGICKFRNDNGLVLNLKFKQPVN